MGGEKHFSTDSGLNKLLEKVVDEVRAFAEGQIRHIQRLSQIGIGLSAEKNISKLLEMIIDEAMRITNADAGTLYTVNEDEKHLRFEILKNHTLNIQLGGTSGNDITLPPVPLEIEGEKNFSNVSSCVALTGQVYNIPDVYEYKGFDFTGPKKYDAQTGYRSQSMLVIPMSNHENEVIGVLQLLNAKDSESGEVIPFARDNEEMVISLASQAAVALENAQLIQSLKDLFESFIKSIATAIDEKSPYTGGHIRRVTELTMMIAHKINDAKEGPFAEVIFSEDELEELRIASWMHDVGKITTPEYVIDKSHKLETLCDRIELVKTRFDFIKQLTEKEYLQKKIELLEDNRQRQEEREQRAESSKQKTEGSRQGESDEQYQKALARLETTYQEELSAIEQARLFVIKCNAASRPMSDNQIEMLKQIARKTYEYNGERRPYLTKDELHNLSIRKGTLTARERKIIENHASMSIKILNQLPFPKKLANVPRYAGGHHEKLDGSGYPQGLTAEELPLQARIMALADIFEALTAKDRPYKSPMKLSKAVQILESMCTQNHLDSDIYDLFIKSGLYIDYAEKELNREQIDVVEESAK